MKKVLIILVVTAIVFSGCARKKTQETNDQAPAQKSEEIFEKVDSMPGFQGGDVIKFEKWVHENVEYPQIAAENGIQGKVFVMFVVEADGSLSNILIMRGVDPALDNESIKVVKSSPEWSPGRQAGKAVRVRMSVTIDFKLD